MLRVSLFPLTLTCVFGGAACTSQVTPDYLGESLLALTGRVIITEDRTEGTLVPALAFENTDLGRLDIMDVEARGEFPSSFSLDVYLPPQKAALRSDVPGSPRFALGYIAAVTADHPPSIRFSEVGGAGGSCDADGCYEEYETCTADRSACYRETRRCDVNMQNCVVTSISGDPSIMDDRWQKFAGLSANYRVLYLDAPAQAQSELSLVFAAGAQLTAGYHLLEVRSPTTSEIEARAECRLRAQTEVLDAYNQEHGTSLVDLDVEGCRDDGSPCVQPTSEDLEAIDRQIQERTRELACPRGDLIYTLIQAPEQTPITIQIEPDVGPFAASGGPGQ